jgi:hypothetical protein
MRTVTARQARTLRALAASVLTTLVAATAHTIGGGGAPSPMVLLIAVLLSMPVALLLSGRRATAARTSFAVAGAQAVYHAVFAIFGMSVAFAAPSMDHMHAAEAMPAAMSADPGMGLFAPAMLTMHALAAALTIVVLVHGERLLRAIRETVWPRLLRRLFVPLVVRAVEIVDVRLAAPVVRRVAADLRRRGPPVLA